MRVGVFGGSFDPPHHGHLLAASDAVEMLSLDRLVFVPNNRQPLKPSEPRAAAPDRLEMVRRLCHGDGRFEVDPSEVDRGGLSFTVDTLREFRARWPAAALFLLLGDDAIGTLPSWREPDVIQALAEVVAVTRGEPAGSGWGGKRIDTRRVDVSSSEIRARIRDRKPLTGFVPESVAAYIEDRQLYR